MDDMIKITPITNLHIHYHPTYPIPSYISVTILHSRYDKHELSKLLINWCFMARQHVIRCAILPEIETEIN